MRSKNTTVRHTLIAQFGGACQVCGYHRCLRALHFHHVDDSEKYAWSSGGSAAVEEVRAHPERFRLLCANCHIEAHAAMDIARRDHRICPVCKIEFLVAPSSPSRFCGAICAAHGRRRTRVLKPKAERLIPRDRSASMRRAYEEGIHARAGAKLTDDQVREIRRRYAVGTISQRALGAEYGLSQAATGELIRRVTWRHIE